MNIVKVKRKIDDIFKNLLKFNPGNLVLSKFIFFNKRYSNYLLNDYEYRKKLIYLNSYPTEVSLNTTNLCNYRCQFCEIHYFYEFAKKESGKLFPNNINVDFINKFNNLFERIISVELSGASGEPMINPHFLNVCRNLKEKNIVISVTTNGSLLNVSLAKSLVDMGFDHILISLHAGDKKTYFELQGGNFDKIIKNIENLIKIRKSRNFKLPLVSINCLIFRPNQHTIKNLILRMKEIGVDEININHYYASRNKIENDVSFYFHPEEGNRLLKEIYNFAKQLDFRLTPEKPRIIKSNYDEESYVDSHICAQPWNSLKLKGCVHFENSHYVSVCNRIILFRLNYEEFDGDIIEDIWNHEIIRYLRKTAMKNPICRFCHNPVSPKLRCLDNKQYQITRDKVIKEFFKEVYRTTNIKPRKGLYLLKKNPYEYINYYESKNINLK
ncbi:MAG: radical SAM protein [Promethearchaeota archaeon]